MGICFFVKLGFSKRYYNKKGQWFTINAAAATPHPMHMHMHTHSCMSGVLKGENGHKKVRYVLSLLQLSPLPQYSLKFLSSNFHGREGITGENKRQRRSASAYSFHSSVL